MTDEFHGEQRTYDRRSILKGAVMLGSGTALSVAMPSLANAATTRVSSDATVAAVLDGRSGLVAATGASTGAGRFSPGFLSNQMFTDCPLNFTPAAPMLLDGNALATGALVQPNGDILFRIYAPDARDVSIKFDLVRDGGMRLIKQPNGVFEGLLPYDDEHTGPMSVDVSVDGMGFLYPFMPIHWSGSRPHNFVEVPDATMDFMLIKDVPHGAMSREIYWTEVVKDWQRCIVYTPPGYMKSNKHYPVLYLQHGGGENELVWGYAGRMAYILDNLIAEGKAQPFIVVMNNGMVRYPDNTSDIVDEAFERILIESCIPHVEKNYRVTTGKWNRAIAGLSMGSMMSCDIAFRHPETFGNLGTFTASMTHETFRTTYERPWRQVMKDGKAFARNYRIYFRSTTPKEDHYGDYFLADDKLCADAGIDKLAGYHRIIYPPRTTKWNSWRLGLRDFAPLLFRPTSI